MGGVFGQCHTKLLLSILKKSKHIIAATKCLVPNQLAILQWQSEDDATVDMPLAHFCIVFIYY